jgi:DNA-binding protein
MENQFNTNKIVRPVAKKNEIFVTRKKPVKVYEKRIEKLLDLNVANVFVHGSGMAVGCVVRIVARVKKYFGKCDVRTSSVAVLDEVNGECKIRMIPGIHVELIRK